MSLRRFKSFRVAISIQIPVRIEAIWNLYWHPKGFETFGLIYGSNRYETIEITNNTYLSIYFDIFRPNFILKTQKINTLSIGLKANSVKTLEG